MDFMRYLSSLSGLSGIDHISNVGANRTTLIGIRHSRDSRHLKRLFVLPLLLLVLSATMVLAPQSEQGGTGGIQAASVAIADTARTAPILGKAGISDTRASVLTPTTTPTPDCGLRWRVVTSPNPGETRDYLFGVAVVSPSDVWAVGSYHQPGATYHRTLTLHWDGVQWTQIPSPNVDGSSHTLESVAAVSTNDVWAVGHYDSNDPGEYPLVMHWDGVEWSIVPSPFVRVGTNILREVAVVSTDDIWAVGTYGENNRRRTLVEHWDGEEWTIVPSPNANQEDNELWDVSAVSSDDVWAVGFYRNETTGEQETLIMRWNGEEWEIVPSPNYEEGFQNTLRGVSAVGTNDVWAVGFRGGGAFPSLIEHWNGHEWSLVPSPHVSTGLDFPDAVSAFSSNDVWAVGNYLQTSNLTLVLHWNGQEWIHIVSPSPGGLSNHLEDVDAFSANDVWAVGYMRECGMCPWQTLIMRYSDPCPASTPSPTASPTMAYTTTPLPFPSSTGSPTPTPLGATVTPTSTGATGTATATPCPISFTDVFPTDYFYEAARYLYCAGVISGYSDGTFRPYANTTRGQLTKIVVLAFGIPIYTPPAPTFTDVPAVHTFYQYIETAAYEGLVSGYADGTFRPQNDVTRGQLSKIVVEAAGWPLVSPPTPTFTDVPSGHTFYQHIETAFDRGIISGYADGTFRPGNPATRGQISKIVFNAVTSP